MSPTLVWRRGPSSDSPAIHRAAAIAANVLSLHGPPSGDVAWVLIVEAAATGPTMPSSDWDMEIAVDGQMSLRGPDVAVELVQRELLLQRLATDDPEMARAIEPFADPLVLVLAERDGRDVSVCSCRMHNVTRLIGWA